MKKSTENNLTARQRFKIGDKVAYFIDSKRTGYIYGFVKGYIYEVKVSEGDRSKYEIWDCRSWNKVETTKKRRLEAVTTWTTSDVSNTQPVFIPYIQTQPVSTMDTFIAAIKRMFRAMRDFVMFHSITDNTGRG